jgi:pimeloyl-ACP methyl ester carboxylesterase
MLCPYLCVMSLFFSALAAWIAAFEVLARSGGYRGASWGVRGLGPLVSLLFALNLRRVGRPTLPGYLALFAALPMALVLHLGLSTVRNWRLNPLQRLQPGTYPDRTVERLDVPGPYGPIPALLVTPLRSSTTQAVLVVHGSGCDKTFYAWRLTDALLAEGMAVLLIDLDGHGESERPQAFPDILGCVTGSVAWLRERYARIGVLAMSLGGAVSARAIAEGVAVDALVIEESPPQIRLDLPGYRRVQRLEAQRLLTPRLLHLFDDGNPYHVVRAWRSTGIRASIGTWDLFDALDLLGSLRRIGERPAHERPPTLLVYGDKDSIVPNDQMARVREVAQGWARFELLPGASHISLPIELRTIRLACAWFRQHLS